MIIEILQLIFEMKKFQFPHEPVYCCPYRHDKWLIGYPASRCSNQLLLEGHAIEQRMKMQSPEEH